VTVLALPGVLAGGWLILVPDAGVGGPY